MVPEKTRLLIAVIAGFLAAGSAGAIDPCGDAGRAEVMRANRVSKPARGNIDELPAKVDETKPPAERFKAIDNPNFHGDQCRAVLGPIPRFNCADGFLVPVTRNGKKVTFEHGVLAEDGVPADPSILNDCDAPAMLPYLFVNPRRPGGKGKKATEGCTPNARMGHLKVGPVDWVFFCHWHSGLHEKNELYDFITAIGSNPSTGETCFFGHDQFKMNGVNLTPPGGAGPDDRKGREESAKFWNLPSHNTCLRCHSTNKAWTLTPHVNQSRLGGDGSMEFLPEVPREKRLKPGWGYRVIGTVHNLVMVRPKAIWPKNDDGSIDHTCTKCHVQSDTEENLRLSRDAVGLPDLPKWAERSAGMPRTKKPWMPSDHFGQTGNLEKYQAAVKRLERAVFDPKYRAKEEPILSPCPAPKKLSSGDVSVSASPDGGGSILQWKYRNDLGGVATRDDVRFEVALKGSDGTSCGFRDVAPEALGSDRYRFALPAKAGVKYEYEVRPYRYCFDLTPYEYADAVKVPGVEIPRKGE